MSKKPKIDLELGASAKAEFRAEVRTEIPSASTGRLVDALTDAIRPFTEKWGLRADQIRLQREEILIEIARRARKRLKLENASVASVPNRVLVPLLEKASLTDSESEPLMEAWSNILAAAARDGKQNHALFVDVLSKLDAGHLRFLEFLARPESSQPPDEFLQRTERDVQEWVIDKFSIFFEKSMTLRQLTKEADLFGTALVTYLAVPGCSAVAGGITVDDVPESHYFELPDGYSVRDHPEAVTGALESLNLVRRISLAEPTGSSARYWVDYIHLTMFGYEFFYAAHSGQNIWE